MKETKNIKRAKDRMNSFSARGSKCPICKRDFRRGCEHSVVAAKGRLFQDYVRAIATSATSEK